MTGLSPTVAGYLRPPAALLLPAPSPAQPQAPPTDPQDVVTPSDDSSVAQATQLALKILETKAIILDSTLPSGHDPQGADALTNIRDTSEGKPAKRSDYEGAPGGTVPLDPRMLAGLLSMGQDKGYNLEISTIAGGSHSKNSRHYAGIAFDVSYINGVEVSIEDGIHQQLMADLRSAGATEVLGPGAAGHDHHVHVAWPRRPEIFDDIVWC